VLIFARSALFNLLFYLNVVVHLVATVPAFFMPYRAMIAVGRSWARTNLWLLRVICDIRLEIVGLEKLPPGALIVAAKHQSVLETFAFVLLFADPTYIVKRELMWIPWFGWCLWKARMIPVDRGARAKALTRLTARARTELRRGRQLIIFPEGTRRPPGAPPSYKYGVAHIYAETGVPCLPLALNSGLVWGRRSFRRFPGTVRFEILDPIPPGLDKEAMLARLRHDIESATARLMKGGEGTAHTPPA
jgi:1-acyl-sn-glycerol-3-phosphate acyltransferase